MKQLFLDKSISFLNKYNDYSDLDIMKLQYGLEGIYLTLTKTVVILFLATILGILKEVLAVIVLFNIIRYTGFGFHAEKSYQCLIISTINFVVIPFIMLNIEISKIATLLICAFCILNYVLFAPADTAKRPLPNRKKRLIRKFLTVLIGVIYTILIFIIDNSTFTSLVLSSLMIQVIVINPLTYKIFKQPYNNYKLLNQA